MKKLFWLPLFLLIFWPAGAEERAQRVVEIKNGDARQIFVAVRALGGEVVSTNEGNRILLSGPKAAVDGTEALIKQLDVAAPPRKNLELTVYMVAASTQPSGGSPLPDALAPVTTQLRTVFPYKGFRLIDSFVLRARLGEGAETSGFIGQNPPGNRTVYTFKVRRLDMESQGEKPLIRVDGIRLGIRVPVSSPKGDISYIEAGINTDVDLHEGQKVVVGKTSALDGPDGALFLVISAKVVD
jgi:hypothetical protein